LIVVIDPGLSKAGVAQFTENGRLLSAQLVQCKKERGPLAWRTMALATQKIINETPTVIIHEMMTFRPSQQYAVGDLFQVIGALSWTLAILSGPETKIISYTPQEWKGSLPKNITQRRAKAALSVVELADSDKWNHDTWDAVAIGLHYFKRGAK